MSAKTSALALCHRVLGAPLRRRHPLQPADAIVVLGAQLRADGSPTGALDERVRAGVDLWRRGLAPVVCMTGGGPPGRVEAEIMARRARQLGVPESALRIERQARNTAENARFSAALLLPEGRRRVWVVSQPFHLRRALLLFRKYGFAPLAWHLEDSLELRHPRLGLRWVAREYAAFARYFAFEAKDALRRRRAS